MSGEDLIVFMIIVVLFAMYWSSKNSGKDK